VKLSNRRARVPRSVKLRFVLPVFLAGLGALLATGCGGGGDSSSGIDPATVAPADASVYVDFALRPEGETKKNIEALAKTFAGVDDLGGLIAEKLEKSSAEGGEEFDFEKEVEP
jgi:hypothetical protein